MMTLRNAERIQSHRNDTSFLPVISSCFEIIRIDAATPIQIAPMAIPANAPLPIFSFIGMFTVFFSINQNTTVNSIMTAIGISSAKNLHIAGLSLGISIIPDSTAHPIKKTAIFKIVISNFFKKSAPPDLTYNYCILASPPSDIYLEHPTTPTSNPLTPLNDIYLGNSTLTLFF